MMLSLPIIIYYVLQIICYLRIHSDCQEVKKAFFAELSHDIVQKYDARMHF